MVSSCSLAYAWPVATANQCSLTVMPFEHSSLDSASDYFSRGFVFDLVADLSRFPDLAVIASPPNPRDHVDNPLTDFVLGGNLRRHGQRIRVATQLVDRITSNVVWGERFDREAEDVFSITDEITAQVVATVSDRIHANLLATSKRKPATEFVAYDYWLQGLDRLREGTLDADAAARGLFEAALAQDPTYARAHLGLSLSYFNEWSCQLWERWDEHECRAFEHAERAHALDPEDHYAQMVLGRILLFRREFVRAESFLDRALALNRNDPDCMVQIAMGLAFLGRAEEGETIFERCRWLNPYHPDWYYAFGAVIAFARQRYARCIEYAERTPQNIMVDLPAYWAAALHWTAQPQLARRCLERYLQQFQEKIVRDRHPGPGEALRWLMHVNPWRIAGDERRLVDAVRAVGMLDEVPLAPLAPPCDRNAFRKVGSLWQLSFAGQDVWIAHAKGFSDIATLLSCPGEAVSCTTLMGTVGTSLDEVTADPKAKAAYGARIRELRTELEDAERMDDLGRVEPLQRELDALLDHVSSSFGLRGRPRKLAAPSDRARSAVTQRIRAAIRRVVAAHDMLGHHLRTTIRTGTTCMYQPESMLDWTL